MINNKKHIVRLFERLLMRIKLTPAKLQNNRGDRHEIEIMPGTEVDPGRWELLLSCYFKNVQQKESGVFVVALHDFEEDGHEDVKDICKKCGCTQNDACHDQVTGSCWWVKEDLCSACATPEQIKEAIEQMRDEFNKEKA